MNKATKLKKLANAIRAYRGLNQAQAVQYTGAWPHNQASWPESKSC
jgi:hypothetical protein